MRKSNLVLEAGAGTGKTTAIVAEALEVLVRNRELDPTRVALITFTEKAAGEIAERVRSAIVDMLAADTLAGWPSGSLTPLFRLDPENAEEERGTLSIRCEQLDRIRSQTIHSFCQTILRAHPIAAGVDAQFGIIQGFEQEVLYDRIYTQWLEREVEHGTADQKEQWRRALEWYSKFDPIREHLFGQLSRRDLLLDRSLLLESSPDAYRIVRELLVRFAADQKSNFDDLRALMLSDPPPDDADATKWILWARRNRETIRCIKSPKGMKEELEALRDLFRDERTVFEQEEITLIMRDLALRLFQYLDQEKKRLGIVDFDDLLLRTRDLLRTDRHVRASVRDRYELIVVDEFQDTDPVQTDIVRLLTTTDDGTPIAGKLIVVGDPKQSIYAFRRADPENYGQTIETLVEEGAERRELTDQFRSDPQLLDQLNPMMSKLFSIPQRRGVFQPAYQPLVARAPNDWDDDIRLDLLLLPALNGEEKKRNAQTRARDEAKAVTAWLLEDQKSRSVRWSEYALLFTKMTHVERFFDAFEAAEIPFTLGGGRSLLDERSAAELLAVLRTIATPVDIAAEISAARSPFFGLTDDEITLKRRTRSNESYDNFEHQIKQYRQLASQLPIHRLIDRILDDTDYEASQALLKTPERALGAVHRLRDLAAEFDTRVSGSLSEFVDEMLRRKRAEAEIMMHGEDAGSEEAVRLMTVHAAKGLEFGTVILPGFDSKGRSERRFIALREMNRLVVSGRPLTLSSAVETLDGRTLRNITKERTDAEQDRIFYVAVTRAIHRVVIVGDPESTCEGFWKQWKKIFEKEPASYANLSLGDGPIIDESIVAGQSVRLRVSAASLAGPSRRPARIRDDAVTELVDSRPLSAALTFPEIVIEKPPIGDAMRARARGKQRLAGILLHRFLELWDLRESSVAPLLEQVAIEQGVKGAQKTKVEKRIAAIMRSPDFQRIRTHRIVGRELPIIVPDDEGQASERRIDLLLHDGERLHILDYKSGKADLFRIQSDRKQVEEYCRTVERMSGERCEGYLWYIDVDEAQLVDARGSV